MKVNQKDIPYIYTSAASGRWRPCADRPPLLKSDWGPALGMFCNLPDWKTKSIWGKILTSILIFLS